MSLDGKEIKILGAGISGLAAAINLAREGFKVSVYERGGDCGTRHHGDWQGIENWTTGDDALEELASMNIEPNFDCHPFSALVLSNAYETLNLYARRPLFYLVKRGSMAGSLDQGLKKQAIALGVRIHFNSEIEGANIIATGPNPHGIVSVAKGIIFNTRADDIALIVINNEVVNKGYAYLLVCKGYGCMGVVLFDKFAEADRSLQRAYQVTNQLLKMDVSEEREFGGFASFSLQGRLNNGKSLYIGEAAGLQDLLGGFGMRYALTSGYLAAKSLARGGDYETLVKERFLPMLKASVVNRFVWERIGRKHYRYVMNKGREVENPFATLHRVYNLTPSHRLLFPLAQFILGERYQKPGKRVSKRGNDVYRHKV